MTVISTDESRELALSSGALAFVAKPVQNSDVLDKLMTSLHDFSKHREKRILLVEEKPKVRSRIAKLLSAKENRIDAVADIEAARAALKKDAVNCLILNANALDILNELEVDSETEGVVFNRMPIIVFGNETIDKTSWKRLEDNYSLHQATSVDQLLDMTSLHLHREVASLPSTWREKLRKLNPDKQALAWQEGADCGRRFPQHLRSYKRP